MEVTSDLIKQKAGILDMLVELEDGTLVDVEMQNQNKTYFDKRLAFYASRIYSNNLVVGKNYENLKKVIIIAITNYTMYDDIKEYHTIWKQTEQKYKEKTMNEQEFHIIELPKFSNSKKDINNKLEQWLLFISGEKGEMMQMAKKKNNLVKEAAVEYEYLVGEEAEQRIAFLKNKYEWDRLSEIAYAEEQAEIRGVEKGKKEGKKEGIKEGIKRGISKGKEKSIKETAKKLLNLNVPIETISEATGLTYEEIKRL